MESGLRIGSEIIPVFILANKQNVISLNHFQKVMSFEVNSGFELSELVKTIYRFSSVSNELLNSISNPIKINIGESSAEDNFIEVIDPKFALAILKLIIQAKNEGYLNLSQLKYANSASTLLEKIDWADTDKLIEEASGYTIFKESVIDSFAKKLYEEQNDEAFKWIRTLPNLFFENIFEMIQTDWAAVYKNPDYSMEIIHNILFMRIDAALFSEMRTQIPKRRYLRKNKKEQDLELPKLKEYRIAIESLIKASGYNLNIFIQLLDKTYPKQKNRTIIKFKNPPKLNTISLSSFDKSLKILLNVLPIKRA